MCDHKSPGPRQPLYLYRKALIHARLGFLFFFLYETNPACMKKRNSQLCSLHDKKAISIFKELASSVADGTECLLINLRQIQMYSLCADSK